MRTVLFVCTGNTCRSPMAEAIARHEIARGALGENPDVFVASAGIQASDGVPPTQQTRVALQQLGIEFDGRSKRLTGPMIRKADAVFVMTADHLEWARSLVADSPDDADKIVLLDPKSDLEDPIGLGQNAYDALATRLTKLIPKRLRDVLNADGKEVTA